MKKFTHILFVLSAILMFSTAAYASASQISFTGVNGTGKYHNGLDKLTDGVIPDEWSRWSKDTTWSVVKPKANNPFDWSANVYTFDMGGTYNVQDITLSVDNNDSYVVEYSTDGTNWSNLFTVSKQYGDVWYGMDTFSTDSDNDQYLAALDFAPVEAQYLRIYWAAGDLCYSVGEFQAFGTAISKAAATPIPGAAWLFATGLIAMVAIKNRKRI